jgi:hypothetical protein
MFGRNALRSTPLVVGALGFIGGTLTGSTSSSSNPGSGSVPGSTNLARCDSSGDPNRSDDVYYNFPSSQKFNPKLEYPLWDRDWDGRDSEKAPNRSKGVTRHVILVRHGQYDETYKEDEKRILTPLGREQVRVLNS